MSRTKRAIPVWAGIIIKWWIFDREQKIQLKDPATNHGHHKKLDQDRYLNGYDRKPLSYLMEGPAGWPEQFRGKGRRLVKRRMSHYRRRQGKREIMRQLADMDD